MITRARKLLGLVEPYTEDDIRAAFRAAVKALHPDAGGQGGDMDSIVAARDTLIGALTTGTICAQCGGTGSVRLRVGVTKCTRCKGAGAA